MKEVVTGLHMLWIALEAELCYGDVAITSYGEDKIMKTNLWKLLK